ncbi:hypothetical protein [Streptomyces sp. WAC00469]|uniref:hypothetical protein n=1 Tax=Streptomyces sp. WAC00469 TaxID=2487415 RepID=UPI000F737DBA|nr:hypothetical protein [Streptomyces sp. WAC00469]RSR94644.1 hypothetical protein EF917_26655 [Streptomyces sp. WAC00469]
MAIALAALRGTVTFVADWRQRRQERAAEEAVWREAKLKRKAAEEDARARLAKIPSSAEFGRKTLHDGRKAASGSSGSRKTGKGSSAHTDAAGSSGKRLRPGGEQPKPKPPAKPPTGPAGKHNGGQDAPGGRGTKPDGKKPKGAGDKPSKPSAGVVSPVRGRGNEGFGGSPKGALERVRDRKGSDRRGRRQPTGKTPGDPGTPSSSSPRKDSGKGKGGDRPGPKKVPGVRHGTREAHDKHGCRCRRCRQGAAKRQDKASSTATGKTGRFRKRARRTWKRRTGTDDTPPSPPRGTRRSADEDLHAATAWTETVITVERADRPGDAERRHAPAAAVTTGVRSLPRAPHQPAGPRPGTTRPANTASTTKEKPPVASAPARIPRLSAPDGVSPQHMTDVTLDLVLDHLTVAKERCFATYDECAALADKARALRRALQALAEELREHHNVIGRLTSRAMDHLAETMDVVARKAEEMRGRSLQAAEAVETAHDAMHDAYRPVQDAAAAAGLVMPSARIHNED